MEYNMSFPKELDYVKENRVPTVICGGTVEYHGPHCSYGCDTLIAEGLIKKLAEKKEIMIAPTIYYSPSSYAVADETSGTVHIEEDVFEAYLFQIFKNMLYAGMRNIYVVIHHQFEQENFMPMTLSYMKAAKRATNALDAPRSIRVREELKSMKIMLEKIHKGITIIESVEDVNDNLAELLNLVRYMRCCVKTGVNSKKWYILKTKMWASETKEELADIYDKMEELLKEEVSNAESAIPYVENDSRLGWEPSMLYIGDSWHIDWKLRHSKYVLEKELPLLRGCLENLE